jgi:O-antigen/teichoic acid export membrane protein
VGVVRSWTGNSLMVLAPGADEATYGRMLSDALPVAAGVGVIAAGIVLAIAALVGDPTRTALISVAVYVPLVTVQDTLRLGALSRRDPRPACANDAVWLVTAVALLMLLRRTDTMELHLAVLAAVGSAASGLLVGVRQQRPGWHFNDAVEWASRAWPSASKMTADFLIALSYSAVPLVVITAWRADLAAAGGVRTAAVLLGPLTVVYAASTLYMQPRFAGPQSAADVLRLAIAQSAWNGVIAGGWLITAVLIPDRFGVRLFGESWEDSRTPLVWIGLGIVAMALPTGPLTALRGVGRLNANLATQLVIAASVLGTTATWGLTAAGGMLRGFAIGHAAGAVLAWLCACRFLDACAAPAERREATDVSDPQRRCLKRWRADS